MGVHKSKAAPLVKGSWRGAPEGLSRRSEKGSPPRGAVSRRLTERLYQICSDLSVSARAEPPPLKGEALDLRLTDEVGARTDMENARLAAGFLCGVVWG